MVGKNGCAFHGGKALRGISHPNFTHGRRSKDMAVQMRQPFEEALQDPELLALRSDLALCEVQIVSILKHASPGGGSDVWADLMRAQDQYDKAIAADDVAGMGNALKDVKTSIQEGNTQWSIWRELRETMDLRRKISIAEQKRLIGMQQTMTVEQVMALATTLKYIIRAQVNKYADTDTAKRILAAISADFSEVMG